MNAQQLQIVLDHLAMPVLLLKVVPDDLIITACNAEWMKQTGIEESRMVGVGLRNFFQLQSAQETALDGIIASLSKAHTSRQAFSLGAISLKAMADENAPCLSFHSQLAVIRDDTSLVQHLMLTLVPLDATEQEEDRDLQQNTEHMEMQKQLLWDEPGLASANALLEARIV